jgi:hypothetical protein
MKMIAGTAREVKQRAALGELGNRVQKTGLENGKEK